MSFEAFQGRLWILTNIFKEKGTTHSLPINENKLIENRFANH